MKLKAISPLRRAGAILFLWVLLIPFIPIVRETMAYLLIAGPLFLVLLTATLLCSLPFFFTRGRTWYLSQAKPLSHTSSPLFHSDGGRLMNPAEVT